MNIDDRFNLRQYTEHIAEYVEAKQTKEVGGGSMLDRLALLTKYVPFGSSIFEIGSGAGEDALALQSAGYIVKASDFVPGFVSRCKDKGLDSTIFDAKSEELPGNFDAIYANAVFVHFGPDETTNFLARAKQHLTGGKIVFLSVLKGEGTHREARGRGFERDFQYYDVGLLTQIMHKSGYTMLISRVIDDKWIQVVAKIKDN